MTRFLVVLTLVAACGRIDFDPRGPGVHGVGPPGYLKASNTGSSDQFGFRVAISSDGSTIAVGAPFEDSAATGIDGDGTNDAALDSGAVYVFVRAGTGWVQQAYVKASNTRAQSTFGWSVALSGDGSILAVGAKDEASAATGVGANQSDTSAQGAGAVYVFKRSGATWSQEAYIKAPNTDAGDGFGWSVAISDSGDVLAVGAPQEASNARGIGGNQADNSASMAGAAYVYRRAAGAWSFDAYLKASNTDANDMFGRRVALSAVGDLLAVGAPGESSAAVGIDGDQTLNNAGVSGAVYTFAYGSTWSQDAYIKASNTAGGDRLGYYLALSGDGSTLVAAAPFEASGSRGIDGDQTNTLAGGAGAAYLLVRTTPWLQQAYVKSLNADAGDEFGTSVAISTLGQVIVICAPFEDSAGSDPADNTALDAGACYRVVYDGEWHEDLYLKASHPGAGDGFGQDVAMSADGSVIVVGAHLEDSAATGVGGDDLDNTATDSGAVYVFD